MGIAVAPDVFGDLGEYNSNEHVIIVGASDPHAAGVALHWAAQRFYKVTEDGREIIYGTADCYTPNYVSDIWLARAVHGVTWTARATYRRRCGSG